MKHRRPSRGRRGSALLPVVFAMVALAGMSAAVVTTSLYRQSAARGLQEHDRAYTIAQVGIDLALYELQLGQDLDGGGVGVSTGAANGGAFTATVDPPFAGPGQYTLTATGNWGGATKGFELLIESGAGLGVGMFGRDGISIGGAFWVDSYDSSQGPYASQVFGGRAGSSGDLASNGDIWAGGRDIWGDVTTGPGGQVLGDLDTIHGSIAPAPDAFEFAPVAYEPPDPDEADDDFGGGTVGAGVYRLADLTLGGNTVVTIDGDVELWVDGGITIRGRARIEVPVGSSLRIHHGSGTIDVAGNGILNGDGRPAALTITSATTAEVLYRGTPDFHGLIYAPEAAFEMRGNASLFGAVVAGSIDVQGSGAMHFDESLELPGSAATFQVRSICPVRVGGL